ncbi:hypothetical protein GALMADRAFT_135532 [Galerina marginata CBS 339.88]|uniref:G-protein coupled receptors family 3 profile domain-containing protein n=1 Tax=Galerina marginata (strain CBS 339.88) TaxID=685588 RepID=A0A067TG25_GALM3|nr:hypothetical protein GALMADRAFT_135532 [Galerina marginata CBS 339.88]
MAIAGVSVQPNDLQTVAVPLILAYDILGILGLFLLLLVLSTAWFSARVPRASTWFLLIISAIVVNLSSLLLVGHQSSPDHNKTACFVQAVTVYPSMVLNNFAAVAFLLQVYLSMIKMNKRSESCSLTSTQVRLLHAIPIFMAGSLLVVTLVVGVNDPSLVGREPSGLQCHMNYLVM